jgi:hypothetical protein
MTDAPLPVWHVRVTSPDQDFRDIYITPEELNTYRQQRFTQKWAAVLQLASATFWERPTWTTGG